MVPAAQVEGFRRLLAELYAQPGVSGACLQNGRFVVLHDLPFSDERVAELASRIDHLCGSYEGVGRDIWQVCAGFESYLLLILSRAPVRLSLLLLTDADTSLISSRATRLLVELEIEPVPTPTPTPTPTPAPEPTLVVVQQPTVVAVNGSAPRVPREKFESVLSTLLARVTGATQATKLIQRELTKENVGASESIPLGDAKRIGQSILEYVPNRGRRSALLSEFLNSIAP